MKANLKEEAILLRRKGLSYSEILQEILVAKSTLSLWLRSVQLAERQKQKLTEKRLLAMSRGWARRREQRLEITEVITKQAYQQINRISERELLLIGVMLYWAEGAKSKPHNISQGVAFSNSDVRMNNIFLKWLIDIVKIDIERIYFEIYIHEGSRKRSHDIKQYWAERTGFPIGKFDKIYFKKDKIKTQRKNVDDLYFGLLRIKVKKSTNLNRKINAWVEAIVNKCEVV